MHAQRVTQLYHYCPRNCIPPRKLRRNLALQAIIDTAGITRVSLPPRSPHLHAYAERWVRSIKDEALSRLILFDERALWYDLKATGCRSRASSFDYPMLGNLTRGESHVPSAHRVTGRVGSRASPTARQGESGHAGARRARRRAPTTADGAR